MTHLGHQMDIGMHVNGFTQLQGSFGGLEQNFDLGHKFEERESDKFHVDPHTGVRAFAEPFLALYVSARLKDDIRIPVTLHYARTRSRFSHGLHATAEDRTLLLQAATPSIIADLQLLMYHQLPESTKKFMWF